MTKLCPFIEGPMRSLGFKDQGECTKARCSLWVPKIVSEEKEIRVNKARVNQGEGYVPPNPDHPWELIREIDMGVFVRYIWSYQEDQGRCSFAEEDDDGK